MKSRLLLLLLTGLVIFVVGCTKPAETPPGEKTLPPGIGDKAPAPPTK